MKVINLFAGPGAGKSTTAAGLFHKMKLDGLNVELVTEYAKDLTWEERHNVLADNLYVTAKQNRKLKRIESKVDYAITDTSLILGIFYRLSDYLPETYDKMVLELFNGYENINYFIERKKKYNPIGRNQTEAEARIIDEQVKKLLETHSIPYRNIPGNDSAIDVIYENLFGNPLATTSLSISSSAANFTGLHK